MPALLSSRRMAPRKGRMVARGAVIPFLVFAVATAGAWPALGTQATEPDSTVPDASTTSTSSSTVAPDVPPPPAAEEPVEAPPAPPAPVAEGADEGHGEDVPTEVPPDAVVVPPPPAPVAPSTEQQQVADSFATRLEQARLSLMVSVGLEAQAVGAVTAAEADVADAHSKLDAARTDERTAVHELHLQRLRVRRWAVEAYAGGSLRRVSYVLESDDINDVPRRLGLAGGVFHAFQESVHQQQKALAAVVERGRVLEGVLAAAEARVVTAREVAKEAGVQLARRRREVAALGVGRAVSIGGVAFPITGPTQFTDTFGAPRMTGTPYAHTHEGVDIFASPGAPVVAFERGVVVRLGTDVLGGIKLWLVGQSGTRYYYAHLQGYVPGLADGQVVEVGQTVAYVGNTGNAKTTPYHLHFEIHPGGGPAVDPYPVVFQIAEAARRGAALQAGTTSPPRAGTVVGGG